MDTLTVILIILAVLVFILWYLRRSARLKKQAKRDL